MFNNSSSSRFRGGTFSVVHGSQINYYSQPQQPQRSFLPGEEWREEIHREYEWMPRGKIKLLETISETDVKGESYVASSEERENIRAKRIFYLASVNGDHGSQPSLTIQYTGRDSKKVFERDILQFSRIKNPEFPQLRSFNDSDIPMVIFHDVLIPAKMVIERARDSIAAQCYISFQARMACRNLERSTGYISILSGTHRSNHIWIRPHTGHICFGPAGPYPRRYIDAYPDPTHPYEDLPPLGLSEYNDVEFFTYVLRNSTSEEIPSFQHIHDIRSSPQSRYPVTKFPGEDQPWSFTLSSCSESLEPSLETEDQTIIADGRIRLTTFGNQIQFIAFSFTPHPRNAPDFYCKTWLSQATYVFNTLSVPREEWESYGFLADDVVGLFLNWELYHEETQLQSRDVDAPNSLYYLFVQPPPQLPDTTPDIASWYQSPPEGLYYWSLDPNGHSRLSEAQLIALGLPRFNSCSVGPHMNWNVETYDLMRQWQEAKGFDPTTADFARSMGYPIIGIFPQDSDRFESCEKDDSNMTHENKQWGPMQVDEYFGTSLNESQDVTWPQERFDPCSMDVDIEDCSNRMAETILTDN